MTIVEVRRLHIFADEPIQVRCPDCNYRFFDAVEAGGVHEVKCKCGHKWLLIFHDDIRGMMDAVRIEKSAKYIGDDIA